MTHCTENPSNGPELYLTHFHHIILYGQELHEGSCQDLRLAGRKSRTDPHTLLLITIEYNSKKKIKKSPPDMCGDMHEFCLFTLSVALILKDPPAI